MVKFAICTSVEPLGAHRYVARAVTIPCDVEQRCAPEERFVVCPSIEKAQLAQARLARSLAEDVAARGNCVVETEAGFVASSAAASAARGS